MGGRQPLRERRPHVAAVPESMDEENRGALTADPDVDGCTGHRHVEHSEPGGERLYTLGRRRLCEEQGDDGQSNATQQMNHDQAGMGSITSDGVPSASGVTCSPRTKASSSGLMISG